MVPLVSRHGQQSQARSHRQESRSVPRRQNRLVNDERETGVLTDEMRIGWIACQPILDRGDEVGARLAFRESYARAVEKAQKIAVAPRWTPILGVIPTLRKTRLKKATEAGRIGMDAVRTLLPGPTPHQIAQVAGLLEGPDASAAEAKIPQA